MKCKSREKIIENLDGWVSKIKALYIARRAPGNMCLSALASGKMGTIEEPINNSKGCGGVMRVASVRLMFGKKHAFKTGCELAAITHGHPGGYLPAGVHACIISCLIEGMELEDAVSTAMQELATYPRNKKCLDLLNKAVNHNGDSDSTGAVTGNVLGTYLGIKGIPAEWREHVELKDEIFTLADDLLIGFEDSDDWWNKYPGW